MSKPSSQSTPQGSAHSTPVKPKQSKQNDGTPVKIDIIINYIKCQDEVRVVYVSGLVFDLVHNDEHTSSNDIIDMFCNEYESIHKVNLPVPSGPTNYREMFLRAAGYNSEENLQKLKYPRCVAYHLETGAIDISKFTHGSDYVSRRFPTTLIQAPNIKNSNANEFNQDLKEKFEVVLRKLKSTEFLISAKSNLNRRRIQYVFNESVVDVTEHPTSHEYQQMRLLLACTFAIKQKELNRMVSSSVFKEDVEESSSVPLITLKRNPEVQDPVLVDLKSSMDIQETKDSPKRVSDSLVTTCTKVSKTKK